MAAVWAAGKSGSELSREGAKGSKWKQVDESVFDPANAERAQAR